LKSGRGVRSFREEGLAALLAVMTEVSRRQCGRPDLGTPNFTTAVAWAPEFFAYQCRL